MSLVLMASVLDEDGALIICSLIGKTGGIEKLLAVQCYSVSTPHEGVEVARRMEKGAVVKSHAASVSKTGSSCPDTSTSNPLR